MLRRCFAFLIVAIIGGVLGLATIGATAVWIARKLFVVGLAILLMWLVTRRPPVA